MTDPATPDPAMPEPYVLTVDGAEHPVEGGPLADSLLTVMRDRLGLHAAKNACDQGECGSCTVLLDGVPVVSCCVMAVDAVGSEVTTATGVGTAAAGLNDVQRAFLDAGAVQCGFCTPGLVVAATHLLDTAEEDARLDELDELEIREALSGNLCRCTGYGRILEAVERTRDARRAGGGSAT